MIDTSKLENVQVEGIDTGDYPDFCDSFISYAEIDGRELTDEEYDYVNENHELISDYVWSHLF